MAEPPLLPGPAWQTSAGEHPSAEAWEHLACGELAAAERRRLLDHVAGCTECTRIYRALGILERGARAFDPGVPRRGLALPARPGPVAWRWGAAAALAAAAAAVVLWIGVRPPAPAVPPAAGVVRSGPAAAVPVLRSPLGTVAGPVAFAWEAVPGAVRYRLELLDADGEVLGAVVTGGTGAAWPAAVPARPGRYYWRVVADLERGGTAASPLADFELTGPPTR